MMEHNQECEFILVPEDFSDEEPEVE
jgi:hypothetical protein